MLREKALGGFKRANKKNVHCSHCFRSFLSHHCCFLLVSVVFVLYVNRTKSHFSRWVAANIKLPQTLRPRM